MDVAAQLNAVLSGRYSIEREIGAGLMHIANWDVTLRKRFEAERTRD